MIKKEKLTFTHKKGLHARVAAMIVKKANRIKNEYGDKLFVGAREDNLLPATSLISVTSSNIAYQDDIIAVSKGENADQSIEEFVNFLKGEFNLEDSKTKDEVDELLQQTTTAMDKVFNNIANGVIIVDQKGIITSFNPAAERITALEANQVIGEEITKVIPNSRLKKVLESGASELGQRQKINQATIITNRTPIMSGDQVVGAIAVFQDISTLEKLSGELKEVKALKERLDLILESVQDGICVVDSKGLIDYLNSTYTQMLGITADEAVGNKIDQISNNKTYQQVLDTGESKTGVVTKKNSQLIIISNIYPIKVEGVVEGAVIVSKKKTEVEELAQRLKELSAKAEYLEQELKREKKLDKPFQRIIGKSDELREALVNASKAAETNSTVLIRGESGTGKELVAEAIHYASNRANGPFIRVNCAAIPPNLIESELFGHEKGAFTGAVQKKIGKFELADGGTIFLDEIGELPSELQVKLLRVLQERIFSRVGGTERIKVDIRIVTATNCNLEEMMQEGTFREDLYYRLNVIPILLPPLRARREDIPLLVNHFLEKLSAKLEKPVDSISKESLEILTNYSWPGNIRELQNIIERAINFTDNDKISLDNLPNYIKEDYKNGKTLVNLKEDGDVASLEEYEKEIIKLALKKHGSFNASGKALGITHRTVANKARKYGLVD
ncbi:PAS domain S-box [Halobacteroides halobius DSM 5150]|uniref:HTH-type transcriptional regulatory protein TyrR n=1 Tax=Halobacteroides halobius (strain ATCC 35273 / DSM 5150 / MD-1) TaxID=748449 RepID=L0KCZ6_HALHC|nr:sigma 54-interacting transcriptional regulator [Halobacteroides halobius]AGB42415.1 PAS domain S-box [Halobacteroides halobius DSM 5150]